MSISNLTRDNGYDLYCKTLKADTSSVDNDGSNVTTKDWVESHVTTSSTNYVLTDGSQAFTADQSMGNNKLTNLSNGTASGDAVNKSQLDTKLDLSGGTMSGTLQMGSNQIKNVANATNASDCITLQQFELNGLTKAGFTNGPLNANSQNINGVGDLNADNVNANLDMSIYDTTNTGNPSLSIGSSSSERMLMKAIYDTSSNTLDSFDFHTSCASATANKGKIRFLVDDLLKLEIDDDGINLASAKKIKYNSSDLLTNDTLGSSVVNSSLQNLGTLSSLNLSGDLNSTAQKMVLFYATNDGNPFFEFGSSSSERGYIQAVYKSGTQLIDSIRLVSVTSGSGSTDGNINIRPDDIDVMDVKRDGVDIKQPLNMSAKIDLGSNKVENVASGTVSTDGLNYGQVLSNDTTLNSSIVNSSLNSVGTLSSLTMGGDITMSGNDISIPDNTANAFSITEAGNNYLTFNTTNSAEYIENNRSVAIYRSTTNNDVSNNLYIVNTGDGGQNSGNLIDRGSSIKFLHNTSGTNTEDNPLAPPQWVSMIASRTLNDSNVTGSYLQFQVEDDNTTTTPPNITVFEMTPNGNLSFKSMDLTSGDDYQISGTSVLNSNTLGSGVVNSSLKNLGVQNENLDMGSSYKVVNSAEPTASSDLATKNYVDTHNATSGIIHSRMLDHYVSFSSTIGTTPLNRYVLIDDVISSTDAMYVITVEANYTNQTVTSNEVYLEIEILDWNGSTYDVQKESTSSIPQDASNIYYGTTTVSKCFIDGTKMKSATGGKQFLINFRSNTTSCYINDYSITVNEYIKSSYSGSLPSNYGSWSVLGKRSSYGSNEITVSATEHT